MPIIKEIKQESKNRNRKFKIVYETKCDNCNKLYYTNRYALKNEHTFCCYDCHSLFEIRKNSVLFIEKAKKVHGDLYDYSKSNYLGSTKKIIIICKNHGEFKQLASNHLRGSGCEKCSLEYTGLLKRKRTIEDFLELAPKIHNNFYDYSKIKIDDFDEKRIIKIICPIHGDFEQRIDAHLKGQRCKKCQRSKSRGEQLIQKILDENEIQYQYHHSFEKLFNPINNYKLEFDFYLEKEKVCIEFNGRQHYEPVNFDRTKNKEIDYIKVRIEKNFKQQIFNDKLKKDYCEKNNIRLIIIPYWEIDNIENILGKMKNEY